MTMAPTRRGGLPICSRAKATAAATTSPSATLSTSPIAGGLGGVDEGPGGDHLQRLLHADQARQPLGAAGAGQDAERDLRQPELAHVLGHHAVVAAQRQLQPAAQRRAVDGRHDRLVARLDAGDLRRQERLLHAGARTR